MKLSEYLRVLRRRWRVVASVVLLAVIGASVLVYQTTPLYRSTTTIFVSTADDNAATAYQGTLYSVQRVKTYAVLATGRELAATVVKELDLDMTAAELARSITATVVPDTVLLELGASSTDPGKARAIAASLAKALVAKVNELESEGRGNQPLATASVFDSATLPSSPYSPNVPLIVAAALLLGLALGAVLAFVREATDNTIGSSDDIALLTPLPVLGQVPYDGRTPREPTLDAAVAPDRGEAFRILRTALQFVDVDRTRKVVLVTSSLPAEGKTTASINLAESLAKTDQSVLLVEGDLRRPQLGARLQLEDAVGLTTALVGTESLEACVQPVPQLGFDVLTAGALPPNPSELLQSRALGDLLEKARSAYDVVVIDGPPLLPVADASLLAARVDGSLLVVRQGRTTTSALAHALERVASVDGRVFGLVLNMVRGPEARDYGYGYGYGARSDATT